MAPAAAAAESSGVVTVAPELLNTPRTTSLAFGARLRYSKDGKYLFQREAHVIRVLNTKNGQVLHECVRAEQPARPPVRGRARARPRAPSASADDATPAAEDPAGQEPSDSSDDADTRKRWDVTALALHPYNALQLIATYADGKILVWDFIDEKILQEFDAKAPILWMDASVASPLMLLLVIAGGNAAAQGSGDATATTHWSVVEFNLKKKRRGRTLLEQSKAPFVAAEMRSYLSSASADAAETEFHGDFIVVAAGSRIFSAQVHRERDGGAGLGRAVALTKLSHVRDVTCVAVPPSSSSSSPSSLEFTVGDAIGQLHRFLQNGSSAAAKMHWHSHAVACVTYSADGQFLLSGGEENVLVSWHLESGRRAYLPRRSAPLVAIAPRVDGSAAGYAVVLQDHVLFQYNAITREEEWQTIGLSRSGHAAPRTMPWRQWVWDPVTQAVPLNGVCSAGVLQFYAPYKDRVVLSVLLTERNQVTRTEQETLPQILAERVAFSPNGQTLVTLHRPYSDDEAHEPSAARGDEQALRFWKRREDGSFFVHTAVDAPHGTADVTALAFSPSTFHDCVVTGDRRGEFKIWKKTPVAVSTAADQQQQQQQQQQQSHAPSSGAITHDVTTMVWHCTSVVKFRDAPISTIAFARDGSLVAVAYGALLTLWDLSTMALRGVLSSADGAAIRHVEFPSATAPFVVLQTAAEVQVWNLLSLSLWWRYVVPENRSFVAASTADEFVVAIPVDHEYVVLSFSPESAVPRSLQRVSARENSARQAVWSLGVHPAHGDLLLLDEASNVWRVGSAGTRQRRQTDEDEEEAARTPLAAMFKQIRDQQQQQQQQSAASRSRRGEEAATAALFDAPAHVLPSMTALYRSFMDKMLPKPSAQAQGSADADADASKRSKKKLSKKRKKAAAAALAAAAENGGEDQDEDHRALLGDDAEDEDAAAKTTKRVKAMVERELANPARQQQTYSKLLEAFRSTKPKKKPSKKSPEQAA
ncbi:hypothetical protein ATCC90586_001977 [Pythium insidiosum]|nr:hypothetical protein ATCC90586_001977 [Pythium insidiosum]